MMDTKMPPNVTDNYNEPLQEETFEKLIPPQASPRVYDITWRRVIQFIYVHIAGLYGSYLMMASASWATIAFNCLTFYLSVLGVMAGAHRLWSHRSYKAKTPLQIFLMLCHSMASQHTIFLWARDHRLHHRYSETDADPYNASRGFFFSHVGWLLVSRHPEVKKRGKAVDMTDMFNNPVVMFQKRFRKFLNPTMAFILPVFIPMYFWNETFINAYHMNMFRYILSLNGTFTINSLAHMFGTRPYDKTIAPSQNIITTVLTLGEGFHNYHHTFPIDYKAGELGSFMNFSASFIDFCAWLGLVYDRKTVSNEVLEKRMARTGDGSIDKYGILTLKDKFCSS